MSDIPYNTLLDFVKSDTPPNVLWIYGFGNTGKTTLTNKLPSLVTNVRTVSACDNLNDILFVRNTFVKIIDVDSLSVDMTVTLIKHNPNIKFVIEADITPPLGLSCQSLHMTTIYR